MSINYKRHYCANCDIDQSGEATGFQIFLFILLLILFIIPGIIYYFMAEPSRCRICGLKKRHKKTPTVRNKN